MFKVVFHLLHEDGVGLQTFSICYSLSQLYASKFALEVLFTKCYKLATYQECIRFYKTNKQTKNPTPTNKQTNKSTHKKKPNNKLFRLNP